MKKDLKIIAKKIMALEAECQKGNNITENMEKMSELMKRLDLSELIEINSYMEKNFHIT